MTKASLDDGAAVALLLSQVHPYHFPRLVTIFADQKYHNHALEAWVAEPRPSWHIEVQARPAGTKGFTPLAKLWVIARKHAWHGRCRRNSKDYERSIESSTAMIQLRHIHLLLNRLTHGGGPVFHYRKDAAESRSSGAKEFPDSLSKVRPSSRQPMIDSDTATGRVVIETVHGAEDIIRVSIETARSTRQPQRVIVF